MEIVMFSALIMIEVQQLRLVGSHCFMHFGYWLENKKKMSINQPRNHQKQIEPAHLLSVNLAIASRNAREMTSTVMVESMIFQVK